MVTVASSGLLSMPSVGEDGTVYVANDCTTVLSCGSGVYARTPNGAHLWYTAGFNHSGSLDFPAVTVGSDTVYLVDDRSLYALNAATGAERWSVRLPDGFNYRPTMIAPNTDIVVSRTVSGEPWLFAFSAAGTEQWSRLLQGSVGAMAIDTNGTIYLFFSAAGGSELVAMSPGVHGVVSAGDGKGHRHGGQQQPDLCCHVWPPRRRQQERDVGLDPAHGRW